MEQVAVITGANSGIGFSLAKRLLSEIAPTTSLLRICLACRNLSKGESARKELLKMYSNAKIDLLEVDTSIPESCIRAAQEIKKRYQQGLRWFYCNAGIMPLGGINWKTMFTLKTKNEYVQMFSTGSGLNKYTDWELETDGLQAVFTTNVLGHYLIIKELEDYFIDQIQPLHIIWTSSNTASTVDRFDPDDIQCKKRDISYPHSKKLVDLVSLDLNRRLNIHGIYSDTMCPGMVVSQMTLAIMPYVFWLLIFPIIFLIRVFITHFITFQASNGTEALVWLSKQNPSAIDHKLKYFSRKPPIGRTYVHKEPIPYTDILLNNTMDSLNRLSDKYLRKPQ